MQWREVERVVTQWTIVQCMLHARVGVAQFAECCVRSPGCEPGCEHRCEHWCEPGVSLGEGILGREPILVWFLLLR